MTEDVVSVIIPTYRRPQFLAETVASALGQTSVSFEVIVVEDGSHEAGEQLRSFGDRVRYVWQPNQGVGVARNTGAAHAKGAWLAFLDDDDTWKPGKLARQLDAAKRDPECGLVHTDHLALVDGELRVPARNPPREKVPSGWVCRELLRSNFIVTSSVLVRKSVFDGVGGFTTNREWAEDLDLWLRIARACPIRYVNEPLTIYRDHNQSLSSELRWHFCRANVLENFVRTDAAIRREYGAIALRRKMRDMYWIAAYDHMMHEDYPKARRLFHAAWRWLPWDARSLAYGTLSLAGPRGFGIARAIKRALS